MAILRTLSIAVVAIAIGTSAALAADTPATVSAADNSQGVMHNESPAGLADSFVTNNAAPMAPRPTNAT